MYVVVERFIALASPLQIIIKIQGIYPCFMMKKTSKEECPKTLFTQSFERNSPTLIEITVNKENIYTPRTIYSSVADVTTSSAKCRLDIQSMECCKQELNQKMFLDVKDIFLNHRYYVLQWYESIHIYGDTWGVFIPPYTTLY